MPKYQVTAGVVSAPKGEFYTGTEVTAEGLGIPQDRFDHLVTQGAIGEVEADKATEPIADGAPREPAAAGGAGRGTQIAGGEAAPSATALPVAVVPSLPLVPREEDAIETKTIKQR